MNTRAEIEKIEIGENSASPFSPPDAYSASQKEEEIPYKDMHPLLQGLIDEHKTYSEKLEEFEETIQLIENGKIDRDIDRRLRDFFAYLDEKIIPHNRDEEKALFPQISEKMNQQGKHSKGDENFNVIDVLEDEHVKTIQLSAVTFNMFALFARIPDERSRLMILDVAINQARELIELLKLHIYREDTIIFSYAHKNFSFEELSEIQNS